jgi:two-component system chemotaxis response regulator CheY
LALQGNLEDLPLLDIIQIVSFSKKTGWLGVKMEGGEGAIVFREGLVVSAFTANSPAPDARLATLPTGARETAIRRRLGFALEELARLREGAFGFELTEAVPVQVAGRDISSETLASGINPQEMLLTLAQGLDDDRAQSAAAVEASFATPAEGIVAAELAALAPPVVPAEAVRTALATAPDGGSAAGAAGGWQVTDAPYGNDTRPLPKLPREPGPPRQEPPAQAAQAAPAAAETVGEEPPENEAAPEAVARTILLVDDEADVRAVLGRGFAAAGFTIVEAGDPEEAAKEAAALRSEGRSFVLVTDLGMPASGGASFQGGFEVVKRLWKMNLRPPVLMMTESLNQALRLRARQMGVQAFVFKPTLSKLNPRQFEADLTAFAAKLQTDVLPRLAELAVLRPPVKARKADARAPAPDTAGPPTQSAARPFEFLKRRLLELRQGGDANEIAMLVMKVAREFFERSLLFVVKNDEARGLGGFGVAPRGETLNLLARQVAIPLGEASLFREVSRDRRGYSGAPPADRWLGHVMGRIGRFQSKGVALLPLVAHRETIALVFGDNPETGRDPGSLEPLEVFMQQAGIALENVFLQRKLQAAEDRDRAPSR